MTNDYVHTCHGAECFQCVNEYQNTVHIIRGVILCIEQ